MHREKYVIEMSVYTKDFRANANVIKSRHYVRINITKICRIDIIDEINEQFWLSICTVK